MIFLVGSKIASANIHSSLGKPEYSYYFLLREFLPALEKIGRVIVADSIQQIDTLYDKHIADGEQVVFLSFSPPHQTPLGLRCPTFPVFAWEFDSLPSFEWEGDPRNDWRYVFQRTRGAITTSTETAELVRKTMGENYPVIALPAPTWERFADVCSNEGEAPQLGERGFNFTGIVIDSPILGLSADGLVSAGHEATAVRRAAAYSMAKRLLLGLPNRLRRALSRSKALMLGWRQKSRLPITSPQSLEVVETPGQAQVAQEAEPLPPSAGSVNVSGVVYTAVLNPADGRKNWLDLISAFCWTFKEADDATLIVKMTHHDLEYYRIALMTFLSRLSPFRCRVIVLHGFLEDADYLALIKASTFYVNTSACEGLCIPLMEYLSCGKPAIAPKHTAMADYLEPDFAFLLKHSLEPTCWPHDPTRKMFTHFHRLNWQSLVDAYEASYRVAKSDPSKYQEMSRRARSCMARYCAKDRISEDLSHFLKNVLARGSDQTTAA